MKFSFARKRVSRRPARRAIRCGEQLERRLALTTGANEDLQSIARSLDLVHPQSTTCGCAGCMIPPPSSLQLEAMTAPPQAIFPVNQTFSLSSRPSATKTIYLDFDGHTDTNWNGSIVVTPQYDTDGNGSQFSNAELLDIQVVWARVVEDFSPFDVNVTTQQPPPDDLARAGTGDARWGIRVVIGGDGAWYGPVGGVARVGSFSETTDIPTFVFSENLAGPKSVAEAVSHEVGHTLGLFHDGRISPSEGYYEGHGTGATGWAPIMGVGYYRELVQWSRGEYANADNREDDLAIITGTVTTQRTPNGNGFGYRPDDHGNTIETATQYVGADFAGLIERNTDVDVFRFYTSGRTEIDIRPSQYGPNLDILAELVSSSGTVVATSNPTEELGASFAMILPGGACYLRVRGTGKGDPLATGYTNYGSLGQYTVDMTIDAQPRIVSVLDDVGPSQVAIPNGGRTDDRQPLVSGTGAPGAQVTLSAGSVILGTTTVSTTGSWSITITPPLADGTYPVMVRDSLGGVADAPHTITVDTTPPARPVLVTVRDDRGSIVGTVPRGGSTNDSSLQLEGTAEANATVTVFDNGLSIGSTAADANGAWTFTTPALGEGLHVFSAVARDEIGNESNPSTPPYDVTIDLTPPASPLISSVTDAMLPTIGIIANGGFTNDRSPLIAGSGERNSQVRVSSGARLIGTATIGGDGLWVLLPSSPLPDGRYSLIASATDGVGNASGSSAPFVITVDTVAPSVRITRAGSGVLTIGSTAVITFTLSEPLSTFTAGAVRTTGGSLSGLNGSGTTYTAVFIPEPGSEATAEVAVLDGAFGDPVGYPNVGAALQLPIDTLAPTVTVSRLDTRQLIAGDTTTIVFTLREQAPRFDLDVIDVTGGTLGPLQIVGGQISAEFTPQAGFRGLATIGIRPGRFVDVNGNSNIAGNTLLVSVDTIIPRISGFFASQAATRLGIGQRIAVEARLTESVTPRGRLTVMFDSGGRADLSIDGSGFIASGTYTVQAGEVSPDLDIVAVESGYPLRTASGNPLDLSLPTAESSLAGRHQIFVDAAVKFADSGVFSVNPLMVRDARSQFRQVPLWFTTPVHGVSLNTLSLTLNGQPLSLRGAKLRGTGGSYVLHLPITRVNPTGLYQLSVAPGSGIRAVSNGAAAAEAVSLHWGYGRSVGMVPSAPTGVALSHLIMSGRQPTAVLGWRAPAGNGGGPVTHYIVEYRLAGTARWIALRNRLPATATSGLIPNVTTSRSYEFRVAAVNAAGISAYAQSGPINLLELATIQPVTAARPMASRPSAPR